MTWWEAALLGLIQGLTEFLPVSSSGHLVLGQYLLGLDPDVGQGVAFEVFVHFGTVLSIITVYHQRIAGLIGEGVRAVARPMSWKQRYREHEEFRTIVFLFLTLIPTGIIYVLFKSDIEGAFAQPRLAAMMLLVTATLLLLTLLRRNPTGKLTPLKVLVMGIAQAAAMIPGISRSGATICVALYQKVTPVEAANFSFLMLLPVVLGATLLQTADLLREGITIGWLPLVIGTVVAYVTGIIAIKIVLDFVRRGNLFYFAFYLIVAGILGLIFIPWL
jgi:undecaprenyl-diphosphatase